MNCVTGTFYEYNANTHLSLVDEFKYTETYSIHIKESSFKQLIFSTHHDTESCKYLNKSRDMFNEKSNFEPRWNRLVNLV